MHHSKINESHDSRFRQSQDHSHHQSRIVPSDDGKHYRDDNREDQDPKEQLKEQLETAKKLLIDGNIPQAFEICSKALKEGNKIYGENSIELLAGYCLNAEILIEQNKLKRADEFLIAAYWSLLKQNNDGGQGDPNKNSTPKGPTLDEKEYNLHKATLHKVFAKLYKTKGELSRAQDELKKGIYIDSLQYGPEDVQTSLSYFSLGDIMIDAEKEDQAYAFYNQAIKIWYRYFKRFFRNSYNNMTNELGHDYNDLVIQQALKIIERLEGEYHQRYRSEPDINLVDDMYRLNYALAFFYKYWGEESRSMEYCKCVEHYLTSKYNEDHPKVKKFNDLFYSGHRDIDGDYEEMEGQIENDG